MLRTRQTQATRTMHACSSELVQVMDTLAACANVQQCFVCLTDGCRQITQFYRDSMTMPHNRWRDECTRLTRLDAEHARLFISDKAGCRTGLRQGLLYCRITDSTLYAVLTTLSYEIMATALVATPTRHSFELNIPSTSSLLPGPPLLSRLPAVLLASPVQAPHAVAYPVPPASSLVGYTQSRLPSIDNASLALHHALYSFRATDQDYATRPYEQAFNWEDITLPEDVEREWCVGAQG